MTRRCLDCGAGLDGGQCSACGLTPAAAEIICRRRLLRRTAVFVAGAVLFLPVSHLYPPLELDYILIFIGVLFFAYLALVVWLETGARRRRDIELPKRICFSLVAVPWLLTGLLWANGRFDGDAPSSHATSVVGRFSMPGTLKTSRVVVISWRAGRRVERVPVTRADFDRFTRGDRIEVAVQPGLAGIPWVAGVRRP